MLIQIIMFPNKHCILREKAEPVWEFCNFRDAGSNDIRKKVAGSVLDCSYISA